MLKPSCLGWLRGTNELPDLNMKQTKKNLLLLCLLALASSVRVYAQTLVLHHANGTTTDVDLRVKPQVKFDGNKVFITSTILDIFVQKATRDME